MKLVWSPLALERVHEIANTIAADHPDASTRWVEELFSVVERLPVFPESGRAVPELPGGRVREVFHGRYRVIYRVEPGQISVLTVRHSRQLTSAEDIGP